MEDHGWYGVLRRPDGVMMSFFVMLVAFSTMDNTSSKSSPLDARRFGCRTTCVIPHRQSDGLPTRPKLKNVDHIGRGFRSANSVPDKGAQPGQCAVSRSTVIRHRSRRAAGAEDMPE